MLYDITVRKKFFGIVLISFIVISTIKSQSIQPGKYTVEEDNKYKTEDLYIYERILVITNTSTSGLYDALECDIIETS